MGPLKKIIHYLGKSGGIVVWFYLFIYLFLISSFLGLVLKLISQKFSMKFEGDQFFQIKISNGSYRKLELENEIG